MFRFFVNEKIGLHFILSDETLNHIKVARIANDDFICVYKKKFYKCVLDNGKALIKCELSENHEFDNEVIIGVALIKFKRFEWLIQKAAELGATKLIPIISQNVNVALNGLHKKYERWHKIAQNACEQSFRNQIMEITPTMSLEKVLSLNIKYKFIAHEQDNSIIRQTFIANSLFLIGPEGGFTNEEVALAIKQNFEPINLGPRILRSETAALFVLSRINTIKENNH